MGKRGNGEGSIYRRKDGRWAGQHTIQTATGPKRKTVYGKTRAEVAAKLAKAVTENAGGFAFDAGNMPVGAYLDSWLTDSVRGSARPSTFVRSETLVKLHIKPVLGRIKLGTLGPAHVQALYRAKLDQGLSPTTVHRMHEVFHTALKLAARWRLIPRNACEAVIVPRRTKPEIRPLTPDQARAFLRAAEGEHYEAFFVLALTAGPRLGELRGLRWDAVDFERGRVQVRRTLVRAGNVLVFGEPKMAKGRAVALTPRAVGSLNRHKELQRAVGNYEETGLVFKTPRAGKPVDYRHLIYRYFRPMLERAGLPTIRLHDLRHTCATLLLSQGVHPKIVADVLGHANISMTLDTYSHVLPDMQAARPPTPCAMRWKTTKTKRSREAIRPRPVFSRALTRRPRGCRFACILRLRASGLMGVAMDREPGIRGSVLQRWLGKRVELHHTASSAEVTTHGVVAGPPESRIGVYVLEAVNDMGIEASVPDPDDGKMIYVPWNSVLLIQGPMPEDPYRDLETEEAAQPHDRRQELMERLANAQTATEVAVARGAADAWLAANPSDGDVRMALERLPDPTGD